MSTDEKIIKQSRPAVAPNADSGRLVSWSLASATARRLAVQLIPNQLAGVAIPPHTSVYLANALIKRQLGLPAALNLTN